MRVVDVRSLFLFVTGSRRAHAVEIVHTEGDHSFSLNEEALTKLMLQDEVKDRSVVIVSVAGSFRKGKSFLLDFFIRYMDSKVRLLYMACDVREVYN